MKPIFKPKSACVFGVSLKNPSFPGSIIYFKNRYEYHVNIMAINPKGGEIEGQQVYKSLEDLPEIPEIGILAIRAKNVPETFEKCANAGMKGAIIISGGFAEVGPAGKKLQDKLVSISKDHDMPFLGPNCIGVYSPPYIDTFILPSERISIPKSGGNIAMISQSGGILVDQFMQKFALRNIPISSAVSIGNKAIVDEITLLDYYSKDDQTKTILMYLESLQNGRKFLTEIERHRKYGKNLMVYKAGVTPAGARAALSHTAAITTSSDLVHFGLKQYGVIQPSSEFELISFSKVLNFDLPPIFQGNVVVLSVSGGHGVVCADACTKYGFNLVDLSSKKGQLREIINPSSKDIAALGNPIDLTGSVTDYDVEQVLEFLLKQNEVEAVILLLLPYPPQISMQIGRRISIIVRNYDKPCIVYLPWLERYQIIIDGLELNGIPVAHTIEEGVQMLKGLWQKSINIKIDEHYRKKK
ncbi:MAG: CoA-binding protein [Candidatus Helarchaeota archaeon]